MRWFAASLLFESKHSKSGAEGGLWEERIIILHAESQDDAIAQAHQIGVAGETSYEAKEGDQVNWTFSQVERIMEVESESLSSGTEIFSRFLRASEVASLLTPFED